MLIQFNKYELSSPPPPRPSDPLDLRMHIIEPTVIKSCAHQKDLRITPVYGEKNESIQCRLESGQPFYSLNLMRYPYRSID